MPRLYIAGPMRGLPQLNFPAFDTARDLARKLGWLVISPADLDRSVGLYEDSPPTTAPADTRACISRDSQALLSLRVEDGDAIALLPGWVDSVGASAEFFLARWLGLRILNAETMEPYTAPACADAALWELPVRIEQYLLKEHPNA